MRTQKTVGSTVYNYYYADGLLIRQTWGTNYMDFLYDESGSPYSFIYNGTQYYYVKNLQGDVMRIVDATGAVVANYTYDAWGKVTNSGNIVGLYNPIRYRGYYYDTETGFYYLQSRYYDPTIKRFINADGYVNVNGDFIGFNMFAYCVNNPINSSDPTGAWPQWLKNSVKWVAKNIVRPIVKGVQNNLAKIDATYSTGPSTNLMSGLFGFNYQIGLSADTKGNIAIQDTKALGFTTALLGRALTRYRSVTNAPEINNLEGSGYQFGGSFGGLLGIIPITGGEDINIIPDLKNKKTYMGNTKNIGLGSPGAEIHFLWSETKTLTQFNIFEVFDKVYEKIMED